MDDTSAQCRGRLPSPFFLGLLGKRSSSTIKPNSNKTASHQLLAARSDGHNRRIHRSGSTLQGASSPLRQNTPRRQHHMTLNGIRHCIHRHPRYTRWILGIWGTSDRLPREVLFTLYLSHIEDASDAFLPSRVAKHAIRLLPKTMWRFRAVFWLMCSMGLGGCLLVLGLKMPRLAKISGRS